MADYSGFLEEPVSITAGDFDSHEEHQDLLMLSHWQMLYNSLRSGILLKTSMTIEIKDP
jgi:hypothetical protein